MKNIENHKLVHVETALQRLDQALVRLESAAAKAAVQAQGAAARAAEAVVEQKNLEEKLGGLTQAHTALKETSGRVASKLDTAIHRLAAALQD